MDYYKIGQRVRKFRKAQGMSQEQLAEKIGISVTHMSHIETANTKLSLPVFADIAAVLGVQTDDLLFEERRGRTIAIDEIREVIERCTTTQIRIIADIVKAMKVSLDKYGEE